MQVTPMPMPSAHIHDAISAWSAPTACAAWKTITAELANPTSTVMKPAITAGSERSLKKERAGESVIVQAMSDQPALWPTTAACGSTLPQERGSREATAKRKRAQRADPSLLP
ncbi:hypothetical protein D3C71_1391920 [compost metagenome]